MPGHTTNRAEMREANLMQDAAGKVRSANSQIGPFPGTAHAQFCASLPGIIDGKIFEICLGFFSTKKPRGELRKTKPTEVNRKDAHAAIKS